MLVFKVMLLLKPSFKRQSNENILSIKTFWHHGRYHNSRLNLMGLLSILTFLRQRNFARLRGLFFQKRVTYMIFLLIDTELDLKITFRILNPENHQVQGV